MIWARTKTRRRTRNKDKDKDTTSTWVMTKIRAKITQDTTIQYKTMQHRVSTIFVLCFVVSNLSHKGKNGNG